MQAIIPSQGRHLAALLFCAAIPAACPAAQVTWSTQAVSHANLSEPADVTPVATAGTLFGAVNVGGGATTVKGVPFDAGSGNINATNYSWSVPNVSWGNNATGFYAADASTLGNPANTWLNSAKWHGSTTVPGRLDLRNLTLGNQYQVQLFFADIRTIYNLDGRKASVDGGATKHQYAFCPSGGPYGYLAMTGTFVADTTTQNIEMWTYNADDTVAGPQLNAFQIRDLGLPNVAIAPTFSLGGGIYYGARTVALSSITEGATIHYTFGTEEPGAFPGSGPSGLTVVVPAGTTTTLRAYAAGDGLENSPVVSAIYTTIVPVSGVFTNPAGGSWDLASNWQATAIPDGGSADFSSLNLAADAEVTLDGAHTVAQLVFGDTTASHDWLLSEGTDGPLTLGIGAGKPTVTVTNQNATIATVLAGADGLVKAGAGTLVLTGANTYTGNTSVDTGTLRVTDLTSHRSAVALATGTTFEANVAADVNAANSFNITGTGTFVKTGAGKWLIGNVGRVGISMSPGGLIDIREGTVSVGSHQQSFTGNQGSLNLEAGATLDLPAENLWVDRLTGGGSIINSYPPSGGRTVFVGVAGGSDTFAGTIGSGGLLGLTKQGAGTQVLTNAHSYTLSTVIEGGTLQLGDGGAGGSLATGSAISIAADATLAINRSGTVTQGVDFSGAAITGAGNLAQMGPGTLVLTANNSYTGATTVVGGTLAIALPEGTPWRPTDLDLRNGTALAIRNFASDPATPPVEATTSLTTAGIVTLQVSGTFTAPATYPLIWYPTEGGIGGAGYGAFVLGTLPAGVKATLAHDPDNSVINLVVTEVPTGTPFETWIATAYPQLTGDAALPGSDPDGDGLSNLGEFAFKGDPTKGGDRGLTAVLAIDANGNTTRELTLTVAVRAGASFAGTPSPTATVDGVNYTAQGSLDLAAFIAPVTEVVPALTPAQTGLPALTGSGWEYHTFVLTGSEGLPNRGFLRAMAEGQ